VEEESLTADAMVPVTTLVATAAQPFKATIAVHTATAALMKHSP
jgi:hypothetical protein